MYLGIDQHRKQWTVCVRNEQGDADRRDANALREILWLNRGQRLDGKPVPGVRLIETARVARRSQRIIGARGETLQACWSRESWRLAGQLAIRRGPWYP